MSRSEPPSNLLVRALAHEHTHIPKEAAHAAVHGTGRIGRINQRIAVAITSAVGSMWCAYIFCILAFTGLPDAIRQGNVVGWLSSYFLQLVLLPIIIVGQNVAAHASDQRAREDSKTLRIVHQLDTRILQLQEDVHEIIIEMRSSREHVD